MWTPVREHIEKLRQALALTPVQFRPVVMGAWDRIQRKTEAVFRQPGFSAPPKPLLWTQLRPELPTAVLTDLDSTEQALARLQVMWSEDIPVFLFVQESVWDDKKWWYQTNGAVAWQLVQLLGQQGGGPVQEWGVVDRKYRWALFVTHADDILFCGEPRVSQVHQLGQQHGVKIR